MPVVARSLGVVVISHQKDERRLSAKASSRTTGKEAFYFAVELLTNQDLRSGETTR